MFPAAPFPQLLVSPAHSGGEDTAAEDEAELADTTEAAATDTDTDGLATSTSYTTEDKQVRRRNISTETKAANNPSEMFSQSRRRPLLGPSPG